MKIICETFSEHYLLGKIMNESKRARGETVKACPTSVWLLQFQRELEPDQDDAKEPVPMRTFPLFNNTPVSYRPDSPYSDGKHLAYRQKNYFMTG